MVKHQPKNITIRKQSIALLNKKLVDFEGSQDDSVLATLLILCLFHVCDSGFTKFKTQLAGVQKLLSLRDRNVRSEFVGWIETFFTWVRRNDGGCQRPRDRSSRRLIGHDEPWHEFGCARASLWL